MDYSFLKLYDSMSSSLNDNKFKDANLLYQTSIQLFPDEAYLQITNYSGGISLGFDCNVFVVDCFDNVLADITNNVFVDQFIDVDGFTQCKIEFINLNVDFHGRKVMIKFQINSSDAVYYTKPIKISHKESVRTYRFDYTSNRNMQGISYVSAVAYQSIRLALKFTGYSNNSEVGEYYQISTGNNISTRFLRKMGENFIAQNIDIFTFERLQEVFMHDIIYIDGKRLTNNPILEPQEQIGNTDLIKANFTAYLNEADTYEYEFQVFEGLFLNNYNPFGLYVTGYQIEALSVDANINIELLTGSLRVYDSSDTLIYDFNESDMVINSDTQLKIISTGTPVESLPNGTYYVNIDAGLVTGLGVLNEAITDSITWTFTIADGQFNRLQFNNSQFLTN